MPHAAPERSLAFSGLAVLLTGAVGGALERGWPSAADPAAVASFIEQHRTAILGQSMAFVLSAAIYVWFFAALRSLLARAEGEGSVLSSLAFGGGLVWAALQMVSQALQVGVAMAPTATLQPATLWMMAAVFSISNLPLALTLLATALVAFRTGVLPRWLAWIAVFAAGAQVALWIGTVVRHGPLAPDGWLTYVLYPSIALFLLPTTVLMFRRARAG